MSIKAFNDFISRITHEDDSPAKDSASSVAAIIGDFDKSLTGEAKGMAVMAQLVKAAEAKGYDVSIDDVVEYMRSLKTQYETNAMLASMMDSYCSTTCHLGSVVGKD